MQPCNPNAKLETKCLHAGYTPKNGGPGTVPIVQSTTYRFDSTEKVAELFDMPTEPMYSRFANPTCDAVEQKIAALEGGVGAMLTSSGQAASLLSVLNLCSAGDSIVSVSTIYGGTVNLFGVTLKRFGIECIWVDPLADEETISQAIKPNTKLIYVESPANPTMVLVDIAAVVEIAHKHGVKVFIDNTFATPYNTTPLDLGVDAVIHSLTKYIGGHGDLLGGAVISNDEQFLRECRLGTLMHFGSVMAPFTAFLVCRGLKTLGVRMKQYNESALKIAKWLEANPKIETVRYPFLESNPQYAIAKKQMKGGGGMISFDVAGGLEAGKKFINSLKLCTLAVSLGDTETLVEQAAAMTHTMIPKEIREAAGITDGMIRMSVGLEDPDDIIADLKQALGD